MATWASCCRGEHCGGSPTAELSSTTLACGEDWTYDVIADAYDADRLTFIAAEAFGVTGFPFMVLIDESGLIRGRWGGELGALALAELVTSLIDPPADV